MKRKKGIPVERSAGAGINYIYSILFLMARMKNRSEKGW
jgi:hypothetical protein